MFLKTFFPRKLSYQCAAIYSCIIIYPYPTLKKYVFLKESNIQSILKFSQYTPTF